MNGNKQTLSTLETVFTVLIALSVFLPQGHAIDAAHARASALFRLAMVITGLIGLVTVYILKRRLPPDLPGVSSLPPGIAAPPEPGAIRIAYRVTPAAARRGEWYVMTHRWQTALTLLAFPLFWFLISLAGGIGSPVTLLSRLALIFLAWFALFGLIFWLQMRKRYPRPDSVRLCTTTLTTTGFEDVTPDKTFSVPWSAVTDIREHDGDIFLWRGGSQGNIVNREAFADRRQAQEFHAAAVALWKGQPAQWPYAPAPTDASTWPPPPQTR